MPKLKTKKAVKKRFKISGRGIALRSRANRRHLLTGKPASKRRAARRGCVVDVTDQARVKECLPYG